MAVRERLLLSRPLSYAGGGADSVTRYAPAVALFGTARDVSAGEGVAERTEVRGVIVEWVVLRGAVADEVDASWRLTARGTDAWDIREVRRHRIAGQALERWIVIRAEKRV